MIGMSLLSSVLLHSSHVFLEAQSSHLEWIRETLCLMETWEITLLFLVTHL